MHIIYSMKAKSVNNEGKYIECVWITARHIHETVPGGVTAIGMIPPKSSWTGDHLVKRWQSFEECPRLWWSYGLKFNSRWSVKKAFMAAFAAAELSAEEKNAQSEDGDFGVMDCMKAFTQEVSGSSKLLIVFAYREREAVQCLHQAGYKEGYSKWPLLAKLGAESPTWSLNGFLGFAGAPFAVHKKNSPLQRLEVKLLKITDAGCVWWG